MAELKQIILSDLDGEEGIDPYFLFDRISSKHQIDRIMIRDAFFLLISSGDIALSKNLKAQKL